MGEPWCAITTCPGCDRALVDEEIQDGDCIYCGANIEEEES